LRKAILDGRLPLEAPLPSLHELAQLVGVSRSTIARSFDALASQGYIKTSKGSGTRVSKRLPGDLGADAIALNGKEGP
jgi:GntR family transcriptional regulator/MocR family aminotransferase